MQRHFLAVLSLAPLLAPVLTAQSSVTDPEGTYTQSKAAPIQRSYTSNPSGPRRGLSGVTTTQLAQGIFVRVGAGGAVSPVKEDAGNTELRVDRGVVNISVHHPADGSLILIDFPGGQVDLVKDGFYTFNAETKVVRVLRGEALVFAANKGDRGTKVKEEQQFSLTGATHAKDFSPAEARGDVLPFPRTYQSEYSDTRYGYYGPYGNGLYAGYYGAGYPYGYDWGYPYGYPLLGVGLGYGFYGGYGFHGGYYGGLRGRR